MIIATAFLVGAYPPVVWAALLALVFLPLTALAPLAVLYGMTRSLVGLWQPRSLGWLGTTLTFLFGWMLSVATLGNHFFDGPWDRDAWMNAAAAAYFTLALATMLAMKDRWDAWAEAIANRSFRAGA